MLWALQDVGEETCNLVDRNTIEEKGEKERRTVVRSYTMSKLKLGSFTLLFRRARNYSRIKRIKHVCPAHAGVPRLRVAYIFLTHSSLLVDFDLS